MQYGPRIVTDGCVLALDAADRNSYPGNGNVWNDLTSNNNHGTLSGGPTYSSENLGSIIFDGVDDNIVGVHNSLLDLTGNMTIECVFKKTAARSDWVRVIGKGGTTASSTDRSYGLWYNDLENKFLYQRYGASNADLLYSSSIVTNTWYHMIGVSLGTNHTLYLNGNVVATVTAGSTFNSTTQPYRIGYAGFHTYHIGPITNCRIYNRALSASEVLQNFNAMRGRYGV